MDTFEPMFSESGRLIDETENVMPSVIETVWRENQDIEPKEILIAENIESLSGDNIDTIEPMFSAKLICAFGFVYADCWFSHEATQMYDY